jgi:predicted Kef-type K+ transport protein
MNTLVILITSAFVLGLLARRLGLPPLVGFLTAGFAVNAMGVEPGEMLGTVAHLGVLVLLFTVGMKIRLKNVLRPEVWGVAVIHLMITGSALAVGINLAMGLPWRTAALLGVALAFSSTVVAAKMLEAKQELRAFHGRVAIGILIIQDLVAVAILSTMGGHAPSPWALGLLGLPLLRPLIHRLLDWSGHEELLVLCGMVLAVTLGGAGFEYLGLSEELGALVFGALLADHTRERELADALWGIKEFFLVAFFLEIGLTGLPALDSLSFGVVVVALLPLKAVLFTAILLAFKLRARSGFLTGLSLASYSEFGLIVAQLAVRNGLLPQFWLVRLAVTVALSFVLVAPIHRLAHGLYERLEPRLTRFERSCRHPDDEPVSLGSATIAIFGMGRLGSGAYDYLRQRGEVVAGLDSDPARVQRHLGEGRRVVYADAEDPAFWQRLNLSGIRAVMLALPDLDSKLFAVRSLRKAGYQGLITATNMYPEEVGEILGAGCTTTYNYFEEAGVGFAEHTWQALSGDEAAGKART